ncbi:unnamed protein product [Gordionus sp. m RMFG-2023]
MKRQGEEWQYLRKTIQKRMMNVNAASPFIEMQEKTADDLIKLIRHTKSNQNSEIKDFIVYLQRWSLESIVSALLGQRLGCLELSNNNNSTEMDQLISDTCTIFESQYKLMIGVPWWKIFPTPSWIAFINSHERIFEICKRYTLKTLRKYKDPLNSQTSNHINATPESFVLKLAREKNLHLDDLLTTVTELMISGIQTVNVK